MIRKFVVVLLFLPFSAVWAQRLLTTPDFSQFVPSISTRSEAIDKLTPLVGGGYLVQGAFEVWYEGKMFRDVLKLRANGDPDTAWRFDFSRQSGNLAYFDNAVVTPYGIAISGNFDRVDGVAVDGFAYVSLATGKLLKQPVFQTYGNLPIPMAYDDATGYVYLHNRAFEMRRFSARTGEADPLWSQTVVWLDGVPVEMVADGKGSLWGYTTSGEVGFTTNLVARVRLGSAPAKVRIESSYADFVGPPMVAGGYFYLGKRRTDVTDSGVIDPWLSRDILRYVTSKFAYFLVTENANESIGHVARAATSGTGSTEDWGYPTPYSFAQGNVATSWPTAGDSNNLGVIVNYSPPLGAQKLALMVKEDPVANEDATVIEYFVPALKHYFLTGRTNEQSALDALPQSFTRTGMKFAAKSSRYRDIPELPVCRLYASPNDGGSNSHFYGLGNDCPTLNQLSGLKYEGFDFSVLKPNASTCPAAAPNPVWRLFNNKIASNDGNHRYVVSEATRAKMKAQGWVDEGVVFCSGGVTDASN